MTNPNPLFRFSTINANDELDFVAWKPFVSSEKMTNYPVLLNSLNDFNLTVGSANVNFPYTLRSLPNGVCDKLVVDKTTQTAWIERNVKEIQLGSTGFIGLQTSVSTVNVNRFVWSRVNVNMYAGWLTYDNFFM